MPVIRTTPATALPGVRQLALDLARSVKDSGPLDAAPDLLGQIETLAREGCNRKLLVEICGLDADFAPRVATLGSGAQPWELRTATAGTISPRRAGELRAPLLIWVMSDQTDVETAAVRQTAAGRALVILMGPSAVAGPARDAARDVAGMTVAAASEADVVALFTDAAGREALEVLKAEAVAEALVSLTEVFRMSHDAELRAVRAKRALVQQRGAKLPGPGAAPRAPDALGDIRGNLQRQFTEFSRGVTDRWDAQFGPKGPVWQSLEAQLAAIDRLDERSGAKRIVLAVPPALLEAWYAAVADAFVTSASADLQAMRDMFQVQTDELARFVAASGGPPLAMGFQHLDGRRLDRLTDQLGNADRTYQGELPKPGIFEYVMIARRYQILLFMFMSAFGLSFLRSHSEIMIPAAIVLLTLGGVNVYNSVRRERHEGRAKELEKARELMRAEARRALTEAQRAWLSLIAQHLSDQIAVVGQPLDAALRDVSARASELVAAERQRIQRQLQGFETTERRLMASGKVRETVTGALSQFRGELRQLLPATLRVRA